MSGHCNSYGFSGCFAAICAAGAWWLSQEKSCKVLSSVSVDPEYVQMAHYIAIIVGVVLFVLSFFDFATILNEIKLLFIAAALTILASGAMMAYATYIAFHFSCKSLVEKSIAVFISHENVIAAQDEVGIIVMVLDLLAALTLISAAISFSRTW